MGKKKKQIGEIKEMHIILFLMKIKLQKTEKGEGGERGGEVIRFCWK